MKIANRRRWLAPAIAAMTLVTAGESPAHAQNFFERLFGSGARERRDHVPTATVPRPPRPKAAQPAKISAPSYNTYRADPLVPLSFKRIAVEAPKTVSFEHSLASRAFDEALPGLDGFDLMAEKQVAAALDGYYSKARDFIWVSGDTANGRSAEAMRVLAEAETYGLDPADYSVAAPPAGFAMDDMPARRAELIRFEMALSAKVLRYARDAFSGRIDPNRISGYYDFPAKPLDLEEVLGRLSRTDDVRAYLESRHPQNEQYQALRVELEALRASPENDIVVDDTLVLKPGESSAELRKMLTLFYRQADDATREAFGPILAAYQAGDRYADELVPAVKAAQALKGLKPDGVIGPRTVAAYAGESRASRIRKVEIALEQLRWHPSDLGSPRVFINQPAYTATYVEGDRDVLSMRVVIGKTSNQTSFFFDEIEQVDYNPYWGVPQSIIVNEMLPRLRQDPGYLDRSGYEVTDSSGKRIPSSAINWGQYGNKVPYGIRQTPSEANALGELKILFPNKHAIYMHDTPQKALFERDARAFSHGCVRLSDPRGMAAAVLGTSVDYVAQKIAAGHSSERVKRKIPVYVAYFTAWPDDTGKVEYFADVYDRDARISRAIEATEAVRAPTG